MSKDVLIQMSLGARKSDRLPFSSQAAGFLSLDGLLVVHPPVKRRGTR